MSNDPNSAILVADDEPEVRAFFRTVLESAGYRVCEAADGRKALRQLVEKRVNLLMIDLVMPEQDGLETIRAVRREYPGLKIVAVSGAHGGQYLKLARLMGAHTTLQKPLRADSVRETVRNFLA